MKTILIMGGFGFIGTNILYFLENSHYDYELIVFDRYFNHPHGLKFKNLKKVYAGDFSDISVIRKIFQENKIDLIIHSISSTVPTYSDDIEFDIQTNLIPTINLLNIAQEFNIKDIVYISSGGAVYGRSENRHPETDETYPVSSYGIIKLTIEKYLFLFSQKYGLKPLVLRPSNLYGLYHYSQKQGAINIAIRDAITSKKFSVWGDGESRKDYLDVEDFCKILFILIDKGISNTVVNVGSGSLLSINEIMLAIKKMIPSFEWQHQENAVSDVLQVALDTGKLISYIGVYKFKELSESCKAIYDWQKLSNDINII